VLRQLHVYFTALRLQEKQIVAYVYVMAARAAADKEKRQNLRGYTGAVESSN
jgi:hypothetical protein